MKRANLSHHDKVANGIRLFGNTLIDELNYDTFIWTKEILGPDDVKIWKETIEEEIKKGNNIYNMARLCRVGENDYLKELASKYNVKYYDSSDPKKYDELQVYAKTGLDGVNTKVMTIMGTSRQSGKFTTCMILKKELEKRINIGIVGTEPQSLICGIDEMVVPQTIETCHCASTIFGAVKKLDTKNRDLIIVSSQTGIFADTLEVGTGRGGGLISIAVLFGSKPDFTILASDSQDLEIIKKNISAIELLSGKPVIAVTLNSRCMNEENLEESIEKMSKELAIPVVDVLKGINLDKLINEILLKLKN
ncbi:putative NAD-dependent epimerase/dehydratase family protein [Methanococcus maripaludis]|uniref:Putative NAD-dependent epimerase/dehydratase family protein n=1 Tax=Methanococcus maripaludis TaxID=39152 RepID=A0A7J9P7R5_METMI|nr:DUF1611 domain-containing protein [Methanococcus maripaludis]MBA2858787.1 putative NAD-dependent epimerase/dehydratase family protein [Methanococcus maripaludis]